MLHGTAYDQIAASFLKGGRKSKLYAAITKGIKILEDGRWAKGNYAQHRNGGGYDSHVPMARAVPGEHCFCAIGSVAVQFPHDSTGQRPTGNVEAALDLAIRAGSVSLGDTYYLGAFNDAQDSAAPVIAKLKEIRKAVGKYN